MIGSKFTAWTAVIASVLFASAICLGPVAAEDDIPGDRSLIEGQSAAPEAEPPSLPKSPIKFTTVDYQDSGEGKGTLKLAGIGTSGVELFLFFDEQPFAKVMVGDDGTWSTEGELHLDDSRHTFRAEQYDPETRMLSGRAIVSIGRAKAGVPAPEAAKPAAPEAANP